MKRVLIVSSESLPEPLTVLGESIRIFGAGDQNKAFEVHLQEGVAGGGPPPHRHPWDEAFFILDGRVEVACEGRAEVLSAGSFVQIPAGTTHAYTNVSASAKILAVVSDCRGGKLFETLDRNVRSMPEDADALVAHSAKLGVVFDLPTD